jgi:hypothetical protein
MDDRITKSMVEEFLKSENRSFSDESKAFEHFSNYCVLNQIYGANDFELEDIETGDSTPGMDGIAIIVNNKLVQTTNDIDTLIQQNQNIAVKFIIIQTKTSEKFNNREMTNLFTYANCFFTGDPTVFNTEEMHKFLELKDYIFDKGNKLKKNPELFLFYVTLGMWNSSDKNLVTAQDLGTKNLKASRLFSDVKFIPIGVSEIQDYYRKSKSKLTATFNFEKRVSMYSLNENEVGYTGVLPFREFKKLLLEESGAVKPVFEDNIRDYLGPNEDVNKSIRRTLETGNVNAFSMLNNGITIVASHINTPGDFATIDDYQIVNGCQTCNTLLENMDSVPNIDNLIIPIRIIATQDESLKGDITRATNSQTAVKKEQLEALSTFQKKLEEYYTIFKSADALVYERRKGQYRGSDIPKSRIITIPMQIKTVAAMFLNEPGAVSGQYGTVVKRVGNKIFKEDDELSIYYVSALALYKIENLFKNGTLNKKYRRSRYHAMMLFRMYVGKGKMPYFNEKKMKKYCDEILDVLMNNCECERLYRGIVEFIVSNGESIEIDNLNFPGVFSKHPIFSKILLHF